MAKNISDPLKRLAFVGERDAIQKRTDITPERKGELIDSLYSKFTNASPGADGARNQVDVDSGYLSEIDSTLSDLRKQRLDLIAKGKSTKTVDTQLKNVMIERANVMKASQPASEGQQSKDGKLTFKNGKFYKPDGTEVPDRVKLDTSHTSSLDPVTMESVNGENEKRIDAIFDSLPKTSQREFLKRVFDRKN